MVNQTGKSRKISAVGSDSDINGISASFIKYKSSLVSYISRIINHPHDIEDIVHEAFLNSYAAEINTKIHAPRAFLFKTARNLAFKHLTKCSYRLTDYVEDFDSSEVFKEEISLEDTVEGQEKFALFCKAVQQLPLQCRRAFILKKVYGLSHREIAEHLDISVSTVEKHLATGISRCSDYMRSRGYVYNRSAKFKTKQPMKRQRPGSDE